MRRDNVPGVAASSSSAGDHYHTHEWVLHEWLALAMCQHCRLLRPPGGRPVAPCCGTPPGRGS